METLKIYRMLVLVLIFLIPRHGWAYIDLGTGSYLFQILIAGILGAGFTIKIFWKKLKSLFYKKVLKIEEEHDLKE